MLLGCTLWLGPHLPFISWGCSALLRTSPRMCLLPKQPGGALQRASPPGSDSDFK